MGRLKTLLHSQLHVQQSDATRNATGNGGVLHVAHPRECNTQQPASDQAAEFERLLAAVGPFYSTPPEQYKIIRAAAAGNFAEALECFRSLANRDGLTVREVLDRIPNRM